MFKQVFIRSRKTWFYVPFERVDIVIKTQIIRDSVQPKQLAVHFTSVNVDFHFVAGRPVEILVDFSVASFANIREVEMVSMQSVEFYGIERFTIVPEQLPVFTFSPLKILKLTLIGIKKRIILLEYQENIQEYMKIKETLAMFRDF